MCLVGARRREREKAYLLAKTYTLRLDVVEWRVELEAGPAAQNVTFSRGPEAAAGTKHLILYFGPAAAVAIGLLTLVVGSTCFYL
jgi:hypothetical protein